jgi:hypothetical protein
MFALENELPTVKGDAMNKFIEKFHPGIKGVLCGLDRLVLRGTLRQVRYIQGMMNYLWAKQVLLKHFAGHVAQVSEQIKDASLKVAREQNRPIQYLPSSRVSKEEVARKIAVQDGIREGLVCVLSSVEPCMSFEVHRNGQSKKLELARSIRKCLHLYFYWMHPRWGFMQARIQTWFPFSIQICLNGREWLARQMDQAGMGYRKYDNCFGWIEDYQRAQALMDEQLRVDWPQLLNEVALQLNPVHGEIFAEYPTDYYWSAYQSEWAMDMTFADPDQLRRLFPRLVQLGMTSFSSPDILRFLSKKVTASGQVPGWVSQQVTTDMRCRTEGVRIKHSLGQNSLKAYDKLYTLDAGVLRLESTINRPEMFLVYRPKQGDPEGKPAWRTMRRGVADLYRRTEVSQKCLNRYADALANVDDSTTLQELTQRLECRVQWNGRSVRALHPFAPEDRALLEAANHGEFTLHGFRNRDLQKLLYGAPATSPEEARRRSSAVSRKLRMLRAHGLIQKLPHTHRYQVTAQGRLILNGILMAAKVTLNQLTQTAA